MRYWILWGAILGAVVITPLQLIRGNIGWVDVPLAMVVYAVEGILFAVVVWAITQLFRAITPRS